ncbi:MAG TPA: site-2 protease family protein [Kofleriaceae bacterium]|nr:site-2 protease family protein [Kofleriaceae bacterium]
MVLSPRDAALHVGLFVACCVTTWWFDGPYFAATLMGILLCHELGHYVVGRRRGVEVSLPYFIPVPPQFTLGTLGAVIRMKKPISDRNALFDVGAAGPIAGLAVAIPLLVVGLSLSSVAPIKPDDMIEGNSILYALLKYAVFGRWLPAGGVDVQLHPMAFAGWVGLLITMINLMPIGQLDGGHVARAALGQSHEKWSGRLHVALPVLGLAVGSVMFELARRAGRDVGDALSYAQSGVLPWLVWTLMLGWMRRQAGEYHPPVGDTPLDPRRRRYAIAMLVIFLLIATPVPFRPAL